MQQGDDPICLGSSRISPSNPYIIAEIGTNHNRNINTAKELIDAAAAAGVDAVKYQIYHPDDIVNGNITASEYGFNEYYDADTALEVYERFLQTPRDWFPDLFEYATERGLDNIATIHCTDCASFVHGCGVDALKVASMDLTHDPLLSHLSTYDKPLLLSTGMGSLAEIDQAVSTLRGGTNRWLAVLHCVSNYPAEPSTLNLRNIPMLERSLGLPIGFSDHSSSALTSGFAVSHGACIIEKHITLDSSQPGPDHGFALEPEEVNRLVEVVKMASKARGSMIRDPTDAANRERYRRSIVADREIPAKAEITRDHVRFARPGTGIPPDEIQTILGMTASQDIDAESVLTWGDIC